MMAFRKWDQCILITGTLAAMLLGYYQILREQYFSPTYSIDRERIAVDFSRGFV
jgi:hypothetical protein